MAFRDATYPQLVALAHCRSGEMTNLIGLVKQELEAAEAALVKADDLPRIYRLQGKASVLKDLVDAVEASSEKLARMNSAKR